MLLINRLDKVTQILRPDLSIFSWIISPIEIKIVKTHQMILFLFFVFLGWGGGVATKSVHVCFSFTCIDYMKDMHGPRTEGFP